MSGFGRKWPPIDDTHTVFRRWLGDDYDLDALDVVLSVAASEQLRGDPAWLLVVSGSAAAKTETVVPLAGAGALVTSTITSEGALLSATSHKERSKDATGGLLREVGDGGILVIKDVTSILSMNRDSRASVLAALREVYDGQWVRKVGTDGGMSLAWRGRVVVIGAVTTAWDKAHSVVAAMGDRFLLVRLDSTKGRVKSGRQAILNTGDEDKMRSDLAASVRQVLADVDPDVDLELTSDEVEILLGLADVVTLSRTAVETDARGDVIDSHAPEMPTRFAKQLTQVVRGGLALGFERAKALALAARCAHDSVPPLRLSVLLYVHANPGSTTHAVRVGLDKPRLTIDRVLQSLHILELVTVDEITVPHGQGERTEWRYTIAPDIDGDALSLLGSSGNVITPTQNTSREQVVQTTTRRTSTDISGTTCVHGMPGGEDLDEFVRGRARCPECRLQVMAS